jgi:aldehyde:ferredoxin oxidoreductase
MPQGYAGKVLFVDLSRGEIQEERLDAETARDFLGNYGIGAKIIYDRQQGGVDPLGPENLLGFVTGPLVGVRVPFGIRTVVVGKSPITGTWGDTSSGGGFARELKRGGYDAAFFTGISERPVYLRVSDGHAELRPADHLWGLDTAQTEEGLRGELGDRRAHIVSIGPAGEKCSLMACPIIDKYHAPGRSGLGAVMGSKRLKAVVARGTLDVAVADGDRLRDMTRRAMQSMSARIRSDPPEISKYGTCGGTAGSVFSGDCPVKNWAGVGEEDFKTAERISDESVIAYQVRQETCPGCPVACNGMVQVRNGHYAIDEAAKPEYETLGAFGAMLLNDNMESIIWCNSICDRYGLDTISVGGTIAFAMECYEKGLITRREADGLDLSWGNDRAIAALTEKIAHREGFGAVLADGAKVAAECIGRGSGVCAMHIHGQELPMHDPKLAVARGRPARLALAYQTDATPGRHTASTSYMGHAYNATGLCNIAQWSFRESMGQDRLGDLLAAVTGVEYALEDLEAVGTRIACMRQAFNLREGLSPRDFRLPDRIAGHPPFETGPLTGVSLEMDALVREHFQSLGWDLETGRPERDLIENLGGLEQVVTDLYGK